MSGASGLSCYNPLTANCCFSDPLAVKDSTASGSFMQLISWAQNGIVLKGLGFLARFLIVAALADFRRASAWK